MEKRQNNRVGSERPKRTFHTTTPKKTYEKGAMVFGVQSVTETLRSEKEIDKILLLRDFGHAEIEQLARQRGIPTQRVPNEKLNTITGKNHQGVIAFVSVINYARLSNVVADAFESGEMPLLLVLDRITDVRNFGAITRTAECLGVHGVVVPARGAAQINADAMKTSSGALNHLPVCRENDLLVAIEELQQSGFQVIACTEKAQGLVYQTEFTTPTAIVMGSEEDGISPEILAKCDGVVKLPMTGKIESLNVSVATGMILYEVIRQRNLG